MRKSVLLVASMALAVLLGGGVALAATINCVEGADLCEGTVEDDVLNGTDMRDWMFGYGGDDILRGGVRDDTLVGGDGNDKMRGDSGADDFDSGPGNDVMDGGGGRDTLADFMGRNRLFGGGGWDWVAGRGPILSGGGEDDFVNLRTRNSNPEVIPAGNIRGGSGDDLLRHEGTGEVYGGSGEDDFDRPYPKPNDVDYSDEQRQRGARTLVGGTGSDSVWLLGRHDDTIRLEGDGKRDIVVSCGMGTDTVYYDKSLDVLRADNGCERRIAR